MNVIFDKYPGAFHNNKAAYLWLFVMIHTYADFPGVGVTKPIFSIPLFSEFFNIIKTHVIYWRSRLYLTGVAAAQLRWHLSNVNVIHII